MYPGRMERCGIIYHVAGTRAAGETGIYGKLIFGTVGSDRKGQNYTRSKITLSHANTSKGLIFEPKTPKTSRISISLKALLASWDTYNVCLRIHVCFAVVSTYIGLGTAGWMINAYSIQQICIVAELTGKI
jgi:hypothetical protein